MADSLATFRTALCDIMEDLGYTYRAIDLRGTLSSAINKSYSVESRLVGCNDESGGRIKKHRQFTISFLLIVGPGLDAKTFGATADMELERIEDAIISASKTDLIDLNNMQWVPRVEKEYMFARVSFDVNYWRNIT